MRCSMIAGLSFLLVLSSCSQSYRDREIKKDLTVKAKEAPEFAGVSYRVDNGTVTLMGTCPTREGRSKVQSATGSIAGVQQVRNEVMVAPLLLTEDYQTKISADSLLAAAPKAWVTVQDGIIVLHGTLEAEEKIRFLEGMTKLGLSGVDDRTAAQAAP
ncbi:MAG TPA: BON domain-containing protein [Chitinophagaceae bacterium]|nr:BON domain-containing protein [Chitinophagaceae bacterium]